MKNIFKTALLLAITALTFTSCFEDEAVIYSGDGAVPVISNVVGGFFDLNNLATSSTSFDLSTRGVDVNSVEAFLALNSGTPVSLGTYSSLPTTISVDATTAASTVGVSTDDLAVGDNFFVTFEVNTADGRRLKSNVSQAITVSCSSVIPEATYAATGVGTSTDPCCSGQVWTSTSSPTIASLGAGNFSVSDYTGGLYLDWYGIYGVGSDDDNPGNFQDVCNSLTMYGTTEFFGQWVEGSGVYNPSTMTITLNWENGWGDQAEVTFVAP